MCIISKALVRLRGSEPSAPNQAQSSASAFGAKAAQLKESHALEAKQLARSRALQNRGLELSYRQTLRDLSADAKQDRGQSRRNHARRLNRGASSGLTRSGSRLDALFDAKRQENSSILDALREGRQKARLRRSQALASNDNCFTERKEDLDLDLRQGLAGLSAQAASAKSSRSSKTRTSLGARGLDFDKLFDTFFLFD